MTAPAVVVSRLRCPREGCGHFPNRTAQHTELITELGEWRHVIFSEDDRGHTWSTAWTTEKEMA
jgi:hypothetical protein